MRGLERRSKYSINIEGVSGKARPDQLLPIVLKGTGLEVVDFRLVSCLYRKFIWILVEEASKDEVMEEARQVIEKRLTALRDQGIINLGERNG